MGDAVVGSEPVARYIDLLKHRYGRFVVNQTTVTVPAAGYERARERGEEGPIDAYVRVWNDAGEAIHVRCEDCFALDPEGTLESRVSAAVRATADVEATIEDVGRVTIAGVRNEDDAEAPAIYRLLVLFDAAYAGDTPEECEWEAGNGAVPGFVTGT